jgi:hypothetical protein
VFNIDVEHQFLNLSDKQDFGSTEVGKSRKTVKTGRARSLVVVPDEKRQN